MKLIRYARYAALLVLALAGTSCGGNVTQLDGALGAIPIFSPATLKQRATAYTSDNVGDPRKFSTYTWHLETERSVSEVEAFYAAQWTNGRSGNGDAGESDEAEGDITFRNPPLPPDDAPLGESVSVTIKRAAEGGKTQFSITEDVFARRRPS